MIDEIMEYLNDVIWMDDRGDYHLLDEYNDLEDALRKIASKYESKEKQCHSNLT